MEGWMFRRWGLLPRTSMGWAEQRDDGRHEAMGGAKRWLYIHVSWNPSPLCAHPLSPVLCHLCIITQPPSLPLLVSYQTDGFFHMAFTPPSAPSFSPSRSITLMLCGSVGCCVCSWNNLVACILSPFHPLFVSSFIHSFLLFFFCLIFCLCQLLDFKHTENSSFGGYLTEYPFILLVKVIVIKLCKWADVALRGGHLAPWQRWSHFKTISILYQWRDRRETALMWLFVVSAINICWNMK